MRIISLVPSITELLVDLGAEEDLVGITKFCVHPDHLRTSKQLVGGTKNVHLERVRALRPDLVIANREENVREQVEAIASEFQVHVTDVNDLSSAIQMIIDIGVRIDRPIIAKELADNIATAFNQLSQVKTKTATQRVAYVIWKDPIMVAGGGTYIDDMLIRAGFINIFSSLPRYPQVTAEMIMTRQPDVIFLSSEPFPFTERHVTEFKKHMGVAEARLVDGELFSWYGSRMLQSVDYFRHL